MAGFNLFAPTLNAQIKIEERVEINSSNPKNGPGMNPTTVYTDSGFVMWKSGYLKVDYSSHYSYLYHYDDPMPDYSTFNAYFLKDGTLKIDSLLRRFTQQDVGTHNYYNYCTSSYLQRTRYFYRGEDPELYNLGYVEEGDTVRFSYTSDIVGFGTPYTYEITDASEYSEGWVFDVYQVDNCFQMGVNGFSILMNIDRGYELVVSTEPEVLGADDTANVIIQYKDTVGTLYDFPPGQTFELAVLDGCVNGNFMVGDSIDVYFADALQPIKFVTADIIDTTYDKVLIRVGTDLSSYNRPIGGGSGENKKLTEKQKQLKAKYEKLIAEKKAETEAKRTERGTEPQAPLVTVCVSGVPTYPDNKEANVSVQDECDEEIVVCNNPQPQNFDEVGVGVIERLIFNSPWSWTDPISDTTKNTDAGEGCNEGKPATDLGLTYVMNEIGPYSQNTPNVVYQLSEDIIVETCIDETDPNNPKWRFKVKNVRVPIFEDVCTTFISNRNLKDLGDGTDLGILSTNIKNCLDLKQALDDLTWEIRGGDYWWPCVNRSWRYIFSAGIRVHEEKHFLDKLFYIKKEFNEKTSNIINGTARNKANYPCPEDVLAADNSGLTKRQQFKLIVSGHIIEGANINKHMGLEPVICEFPIHLIFQYKSELEASKFSIQTYKDIRERILIWGKAQSWYDPTKLDCLGIN